MAQSKLRPLGDHVIIKAVTQEAKTKSGIFLPESTQEKSNQAEVVAVGPGKHVDGKLVAPEVKPGEIVLYSEYAGQKVKIDDTEYQIIRLDDILAVLEK